jgi:hypothetical protein
MHVVAGGDGGQEGDAEAAHPEPGAVLAFRAGSMLAVRTSRQRVSLYDCSQGWT